MIYLSRFALMVSAWVALGLLTACGGTGTGLAGASPEAPLISPQIYQQQVAVEEHILLDVRTPGEIAGGIIAGAVNIPVFQLQQRQAELPKDSTIVIYSRDGSRSRDAAEILAGLGYTRLLDLGGIEQWQAAGFDLTR